MDIEDEAIGGAALQLKGMAHGWWFENSVSYCHAKKYYEFTKGLVREFDKIHCETSCIKTSNTFHALEGTMKQTPFHIFEGDENMYDGLLRAISPLCEGHSSIYEYMEVLLSNDDQDLGSLLDDEVFSIIDGEDEHKRSNSVVPLVGDPSPHGGENGAIASIKGALMSLQ